MHEIDEYFLNKTLQYSESKFKILNLLPCIPDIPQVTFTREFPICIVYVIWDRYASPKLSNCFLDFARISLHGQIKYTDIQKCDVKFLVQDSIYKRARRVLPVDVVNMNQVFYKSSALNKELLDQYEKVVICDCDTLFYGKPQPLYEMINASNFSIAAPLSFDNTAKHVANVRMGIYKPYLDKQFFLKEIGLQETDLDSLEQSNWLQGCFVAYKSSLFNNDSWFLFERIMTSYDIFSDDLITELYALKHNIPITDLMTLTKSVRFKFNKSVSEFFTGEQESNLGILHPVGSKFHQANADLMPRFLE